MEIICLMGNQGKILVDMAKWFESIGYHRLLPYTTQENLQDDKDMYKFIPKYYGDILLKCDVLLLWERFGGEYIGVPQPVGHSKYIIVANPDMVSKLKERFKGQVWAVFIQDNNFETIEVNSIKGELKEVEDIVDSIQKSGHLALPLYVNNQNISDAIKISDLQIDYSDKSTIEIYILLEIDKLKNKRGDQ